MRITVILRKNCDGLCSRLCGVGCTTHCRFRSDKREIIAKIVCLEVKKGFYLLVSHRSKISKIWSEANSKWSKTSKVKQKCEAKRCEKTYIEAKRNIREKKRSQNCDSRLAIFSFEAKKCIFRFASNKKSVFWILAIFVWIWIRILGSVHLLYGSGSGSRFCSFCQWLLRCQQKIGFFLIVLLITFCVHIYINLQRLKSLRSHLTAEIKVFIDF